jgi:hypothetical protein
VQLYEYGSFKDHVFYSGCYISGSHFYGPQGYYGYYGDFWSTWTYANVSKLGGARYAVESYIQYT